MVHPVKESIRSPIVGETVSAGVNPPFNTKWTPNYNGVNSYVEIPEWKPAGEFEIEMDVYLAVTGKTQSLLDSRSTASEVLNGKLSITASNEIISQYGSAATTIGIAKQGLNKISVEGVGGISAELRQNS